MLVHNGVHLDGSVVLTKDMGPTWIDGTRIKRGGEQSPRAVTAPAAALALARPRAAVAQQLAGTKCNATGGLYAFALKRAARNLEI